MKTRLLSTLLVVTLAAVFSPSASADDLEDDFRELVNKQHQDLTELTRLVIQRGGLIRAQNRVAFNMYDEIMEVGPGQLRDNLVGNYNTNLNDTYARAAVQDDAIRKLDADALHLLRFLNGNSFFTELQEWKDARRAVSDAQAAAIEYRGPSRPERLPDPLPDKPALPCREVGHGYGSKLRPGESNTIWLEIASNRLHSVAQCTVELQAEGPVKVKTGPQDVVVKPNETKKVVFEIDVLHPKEDEKKVHFIPVITRRRP